MIVKVGRLSGSSHSSILKYALRDKRMSLKARGLLSYLLSFSETWEVDIANIENFTSSGAKTIRSALRELRKLGYAELRSIKDPESGAWKGRKYVISDVTDFTLSASCEMGELKERSDKQAGKVDGGFGVNGDRTGDSTKMVEEYVWFTVKKRLHIGRTGSTSRGWTPRTIKNWTRDCDDLLEHVELSRAMGVMHWYFKNWKNDYMPKAYTMRSFCDKFGSLERAMKKDNERHQRLKSNGDWHKRPTIIEHEEQATDEDLAEIPV